MDKLVVFVLALACFTYVQGQSRIINGGTTEIKNYPYAASLQRIGDVGTAWRGHVCGGALITLRHVLTSATCFYERNVDGTYGAKRLESAYRVFAGAARLTDDTAERTRNVQQFIEHPNYINPHSHIHDIGVIALATQFAANIGIVPLSVVTNYNPVVETNCSIAGWGANIVITPPATTPTPSVDLRATGKYIFDQQLCTLIYTVNDPTVLNLFTTMICAATYDITVSSYAGDDGNILICGNDHVLTGVLTYYPSTISGQQSYPEVFTRVNNYTTWIRTVSSANVFAPGISFLLLVSFLQVFSFLS